MLELSELDLGCGLASILKVADPISLRISLLAGILSNWRAVALHHDIGIAAPPAMHSDMP